MLFAERDKIADFYVAVYEYPSIFVSKPLKSVIRKR